MLKGKKGIIFGIANDHSIAWGIAKKLHNHGAELCITYQNEIFLKRVKPLAEELNCKIMIECDFSNKNSIKNCFENIEKKWHKIDFVVHAVAFSEKEELNGRYIDTSKNNFLCGSSNIKNIDEKAKNCNILQETINKNDINNVMSNSFGFGGTNATLVFSKI